MRHGYTQPPDWKRTRARILKRDPICRIAQSGCTATSTTVDHIVPVAQHGGHDDANLQGVCSVCHARKSERERLAGTTFARPQQRERRHPFGNLDHVEDERHLFKL